MAALAFPGPQSVDGFVGTCSDKTKFPNPNVRMQILKYVVWEMCVCDGNH
jgi:hypothetical protein